MFCTWCHIGVDCGLCFVHDGALVWTVAYVSYMMVHWCGLWPMFQGVYMMVHWCGTVAYVSYMNGALVWTVAGMFRGPWWCIGVDCGLCFVHEQVHWCGLWPMFSYIWIEQAPEIYQNYSWKSWKSVEIYFSDFVDMVMYMKVHWCGLCGPGLCLH